MQADHHAVGAAVVVWWVIHHTHVTQVQHIHCAYAHLAAMADTHNVLPVGLVAIAVFLVFADLLAALTFHCAVYGAATEIPAVALTHITLRLSQHTLAAE